jgi:glutathione S-transferase
MYHALLLARLVLARHPLPDEELAVPFEARKVDVEAKEHHGAEYRKLNPKGKVPVL